MSQQTADGRKHFEIMGSERDLEKRHRVNITCHVVAESAERALLLALERHPGMEVWSLQHKGRVDIIQEQEPEAACAAANKRADAAEEDAQMYRFLRAKHEGSEGVSPDPISFTVFHPDPYGDAAIVVVGCVPGELDETIKRAMAEDAKMDKTPAPQSHVLMPLQLQSEALELMRSTHAAHMEEHGNSWSAMNAAYMALVGYYKEK